MAKANHWGKAVDSEKPITGVFSANRLEWLSEDCFNSDAIDLSWEEHKKECDKYLENGECDCDYESSDFLIGFKLGNDNLFHPDSNTEYSAIVRFDSGVVQVVRSLWGIKCALCSPCYPGQGDGDTPGEFLSYAIPPEVVGDHYNELKQRIFPLEEGKETERRKNGQKR
jgi:hypothetical protein